MSMSRIETVRWLVRLAAIMLVCAGATETARADLGMISLNSSAQVEPGMPARLGDVATLTGEPAVSLAMTVIREPSAGVMRFEITTDDIRSALSQRNANWGRLTLRGSVCAVRIGDGVRSRAPEREVVESAPATVDLDGPPTVRTRMAALVGTMFGVGNDDLRLKFDDRDAAMLDRSIGAGARVEIQPASTASSSRMSFVVWVYEGETLEPTSATVRVDVLVRRSIVTATREIRRGESIAAGDLVEAAQWVAPDGSAAISSGEQAVGMRAKRKIAAGTMIRVDSIEPPIAAERGDLVKVHCVSGGIVVKAWARALDKALEGEFVELRMTGSEKTFTARMTGRGVAVLDLIG